MRLLSADEFDEKYDELWNGCKKQLFKFEMLPEYDEFEIKDWASVSSSQINELISTVQSELYACKDDYQQRFSAGMEFLRLRYVPFPLTKYLLVELSSYATSQLIGAKINIIEDADLPKIGSHLKPCFHDFLLFDDYALLKLDNQPNGNMDCGAFYTTDKSEVETYIEFKHRLIELSQTLDHYMKKLNLHFCTAVQESK